MTLLLKIRPQKASHIFATPTLKPVRHSFRNDKLGHVLRVSRRMLALFDIAVGYAGLRTGVSTLTQAP